MHHTDTAHVDRRLECRMSAAQCRTGDPDRCPRTATLPILPSVDLPSAATPARL